MTTLQEMLARRRRASPSPSASAPKGPRRRRRHFGNEPVSEDPAVPRRVRVVVVSYERPAVLDALLHDLERCRGGHEVSVVVYDDASGSDYSAPRATLDRLGGEYVRASENHGKRRFWSWMNRVYADQRGRPEDVFVMLQDDVRLCDRFLDRVLNLWDRVSDPRRVTLTLMRDSRTATGAWTGALPLDAGPVFEVGWVDGIFLCDPRYFEALEWSLRRVDPGRWRRDHRRSSGVGEQVSRRLFAAAMGMYAVKRSLLVHVSGSSKLNPDERRHNPLLSTHFVDGDAAAKRLAGDAARARPRRPGARGRR